MTAIDNIEKRRKCLRLNQKELCQEAGVDQSTYSRLKRGQYGGQQNTFEKLSDALDAAEAAMLQTLQA